MLDLLAAVDARATFFPIAARAAAHPELIARMVREGHTVGLHCHEHVRHSDRDVQWLRQDTATALRELDGVGVVPTFWRTPWGDTTVWSARVAAEHGLRLTGWTADTEDWRGDRAEAMFAATRSLLDEGSIVLAHDGIGPGALRTDARETVRWVEMAARHVRRLGLRMEALR